MKTFEELLSYLNKEGISFFQSGEWVGEPGKDRHKEDRPTIDRFKLPFSAEEWLDIMDKEGESLPMCCGTISSVRDILLGQLRENRVISCADSNHVFELLAGHDGFEYMLANEEIDYKTYKTDPIYRFWVIWQMIRPHANLGTIYCEPPKHPDYKNPIHNALDVAHKGIDALWWSVTCFKVGGDEGDPEWLKQQRIAERKLTIARVTPALRTILEHIKTLDYGDYDGFAICSKEDPSHILSNVVGYCIFKTKKEAEDMIERWAKPDDDLEEPSENRKKVREETVIRAVRVSDAGLSFIDDGPAFNENAS